MSNNNLIKIAMVLIILLLVFSNYKVYADPFGLDEYIEDYQEGLKDPTSNPDSWKPTVNDEPILSQKAGRVLGIINVIGIISSVIVLCVIGIKYIIGSVEEKAEYKKAMIPYIIGAFFIASATSIPNIINKIISSEGFFG